MYDRRDERLHLTFVVVGGNGIADVGFLLVFLRNLGTVKSVGQLALFVGHLADVVEQTGTLGFLRVETQL